MNTSLNATRRAADLAATAAGEVFDVLVVGGGVTGTGVALDAASRGLTVCLLEAHDLAFGTSRWSSKLVHGGLRYLAHGDFALAHESAVERGILMTRTAPHLVRALPQVVPLYDDRGTVVMTGLRAGDLLRRAARTPSTLLPPPRRIPAAEALALVPGLRKEGLRGGLLSYDGQLTDDARLVVALARTAAGFGAKILTRTKVTTLTGEGAEAVDTLTNTTFQVKARSVINAAGIWSATLVDTIQLRPSRGSHLVLDAATNGITTTAITIPVPGERNRYALALPQQDGRLYIGLTDEPTGGPLPDVPEVPQSDVDFLLTVASSVLERKLTHQDVLGSYAGLRPLLAGTATKSADLSRKHAVLTSPTGVLTVVGGKLTTYRRMAADAVDTAVQAHNLTATPCRTTNLPLVGTGKTTAPHRLATRYGTEAEALLALNRPEKISHDITAAEILWAIHHEGALTPDDILDRRTRIGLVSQDRQAAEAIVTALLAEHTNDHPPSGNSTARPTGHT